MSMLVTTCCILKDCSIGKVRQSAGVGAVARFTGITGKAGAIKKLA
jgi:hypothetical protein